MSAILRLVDKLPARLLRIEFFIACLILIYSGNAFSTKPMPVVSLPRIFFAYIVYPAATEIDVNGKFEFEIHYKAYFPIDNVSVSLGHSDDISIAIDNETPTGKNTIFLYKGAMKRKESSTQRFTAHLQQSSEPEGEAFDQMPSSIVLYIHYSYPFEAVRKTITSHTGATTLHKRRALSRLEKLEKKQLIFKALPVFRHSSSSR